jgi:hypothetical protein
MTRRRDPSRGRIPAARLLPPPPLELRATPPPPSVLEAADPATATSVTVALVDGPPERSPTGLDAGREAEGTSPSASAPEMRELPEGADAEPRDDTAASTEPTADVDRPPSPDPDHDRDRATSTEPTTDVDQPPAQDPDPDPDPGPEAPPEPTANGVDEPPAPEPDLDPAPPPPGEDEQASPWGPAPETGIAPHPATLIEVQAPREEPEGPAPVPSDREPPSPHEPIRRPWRGRSTSQRPRITVRRRLRAVRVRLRRPAAGLTSPPAGVLVLIVLIVLCLVLIALNVIRIQESETVGSQPAATYVAPVLPASAGPAAPPIVTLLGESRRAGAAALPSAPALKGRLSGADVRVRTVSGLHYVASSSDDRATFEVLARSVDAGSAEVVLYGGSNDRGAFVPVLADAVTRAISTAKKQAPNAEVVLVGPMDPGGGDPSQGVLNVRATLRGAAQATSAHWVDPIGARWLKEGSGLTTASGGLTSTGRAALARLLAAALRPYLG